MDLCFALIFIYRCIQSLIHIHKTFIHIMTGAPNPPPFHAVLTILPEPVAFPSSGGPASSTLIWFFLLSESWLSL